MTDRPEPMTPPDCDLRCFPRMPLLGQQLFDSDFDAKATAEEFRAAVRLWWAAWQQVPAASLPDDDVVLCKLAGLGRDMRTWRKLRAGMALYGFRLCSDGRLYHPVLAKEAISAYNCRLKAQHERDASAERMRRHRQNGNEQHNVNEPEDVARNSGATQAQRDRNVTGTFTARCALDSTGQDRKKVPPPSPPPAPQGGETDDNDFLIGTAILPQSNPRARGTNPRGPQKSANQPKFRNGFAAIIWQEMQERNAENERNGSPAVAQFPWLVNPN